MDCYKSMIYLGNSDFGNIFVLTWTGVPKRKWFTFRFDFDTYDGDF